MSSKQNRNDFLLKTAADLLERGENLSGSWLRENNVTLDEAIGVTQQIAAIVVGFLTAPKPIKTHLLLSGMAEDDRLRRVLWENAIRETSSVYLNETLDAMNKEFDKLPDSMKKPQYRKNNDEQKVEN